MSEVTTKLIAYKQVTISKQEIAVNIYANILKEYESMKDVTFSEFLKTFTEDDILNKIKNDNECDNYHIISSDEDTINVVFYDVLESLYENNTTGIQVGTLKYYSDEGFTILLAMYYNGGAGELDIILEDIKRCKNLFF